MDVSSLESAPIAPGGSQSDTDAAVGSSHDAQTKTRDRAEKQQGIADADSSSGQSFNVTATSLFVGGTASSGLPSDVSVTLQVKHDPDEIVAVYRDPATGRIISQVPTGVLVRLSEFFDQQAGGLVDWNA